MIRPPASDADAVVLNLTSLAPRPPVAEVRYYPSPLSPEDLANLMADYRRLTEFARAIVEPGADPRAQWCEASQRRYEGLMIDERLSIGGDRRALFETGPKFAPRRMYYITASRRPDFRYVPEDVERWRDPAHRAELMRRAREHAAIRPGVYR